MFLGSLDNLLRKYLFLNIHVPKPLPRNKCRCKKFSFFYEEIHFYNNCLAYAIYYHFSFTRFLQDVTFKMTGPWHLHSQVFISLYYLYFFPFEKLLFLLGWYFNTIVWNFSRSSSTHYNIFPIEKSWSDKGCSAVNTISS